MAPFAFVGSGGVLVRRFKLDGDASAGRLLARAMADTLRERLLPRGRVWLVPVPLHRSRFFARRFNQSAELGRALAALSGKPFHPQALVRHRKTSEQAGLGARARAENVRGAFSVTDRFSLLVGGKAVLLVDDVYTTGATVNAASRTLMRAGAKAVDVLTFARAMDDASADFEN